MYFWKYLQLQRVVSYIKERMLAKQPTTKTSNQQNHEDFKKPTQGSIIIPFKHSTTRHDSNSDK